MPFYVKSRSRTLPPVGNFTLPRRIFYSVSVNDNNTEFSAIAGVLMTIELPVPFAPPFYGIDASELPVLLCGFAFGPVAGVLTEFLKIVIKLFFKPTSTAFVGDS